MHTLDASLAASLHHAARTAALAIAAIPDGIDIADEARLIHEASRDTRDLAWLILSMSAGNLERATDAALMWLDGSYPVADDATKQP